MAESAANEVVASSLDAAVAKTESSDDTLAEPSKPISSASQETTSTSFQAVNSKAVTENASTAVNAAVQGNDASVRMSPPRDGAVAQDAVQAVQASSDASHDADSSLQTDGLDSTITENATYGTRSRNRTGNPRPNYAEDQEMDFELSSAATTTTKRKPPTEAPAAVAQGTGAEAKRTQEFQRFIAVNSNGATASANGASTKESTPGTPGIPATLSKKRKAAGAPIALTQTPPASNSPAPAVTRKVGGSAPSTMARETNIMTFTRHKSCLNKKGELIADDGTKLCVNGKPSPPLILIPFSRFGPTPLRTTHRSMRLIHEI